MSALDEVMEEAACALDDELVSSARAELAALRQRVADLEKPKTCATCIYFSWLNDNGDWWCKSRKTPVIKGRRIAPDEFGCIYHEAAG